MEIGDTYYLISDNVVFEGTIIETVVTTWLESDHSKESDTYTAKNVSSMLCTLVEGKHSRDDIASYRRTAPGMTKIKASASDIFKTPQELFEHMMGSIVTTVTHQQNEPDASS